MKFSRSAVAAAASFAVMTLNALGVSAQTFEFEHNGSVQSIDLSFPLDYYQDVPLDRAEGGALFNPNGDVTKVTLTGSEWVAFELPSPIDITPDTTLSVTIGLEKAVNFHSICLDDDLRLGGGSVSDPATISSVRCIAMAGNEVGFLSDQFANDATVIKPGTFSIPVGMLFGPGTANYLAFVQHYSGSNKADVGESTFGNLKIYEADRPDLLISGPGPDASTFATALGSTQTEYGFGRDTRTNVMEVSDDGLTATLEGNTWRAIPLPSPHEVTYYTRLEFELKAYNAGQNYKYSCIGLGAAAEIPDRNVQKDLVCDSLHNSNDHYRMMWGSYDEYGEDEAEADWVKYTVHIGRMFGDGDYSFKRTVSHLLLVLKNENNPASGKIGFRNIAIVEPAPLSIMDKGTEVTSDGWVRYHKNGPNSWPEGDFHFPDPSPDGSMITMKGNTHVAYPLNGVTAGSDTILKVRAYVKEQPQNLYMCLEDDDSFEVFRSRNGCFRFSGSHNPDSKVYYRGFPQLSSGQGYDYYLKLAEFKTAPVNYLSFVNQKSHSDRKEGAVSSIGNIELVDAGESCLLSVEFSFEATECTMDVFLGQIRQQLESNNCPNKDPIIEMMALYPELALKSDVEKKVQSICSRAYDDKYLPFETVTGEEKMYTTEVLDGGTNLNYMRQADEAVSPFDRILDVVTDHRTTRPISWPDSHSLRKCSLGAAMCCMVSNRIDEAAEPNPVDNSDACYMDFTDSRQSSHVRDGYAIYGDGVEGPLNCHGFAWGDDAGSQAAALKGSALFEVAMYKGLYVNGNTEELPGASLCGCIEQMPVVTEAACTEVTATTSVTVAHLPNSYDFIASLEISDINYEDCGDLKTHYTSLHQSGFVTNSQKYEFDQRIVGEGGCPAAIHSFLATKGYEYPLPQEPAPAPVSEPELGSFPFEYRVNVAAKYGKATQSSVCHSGNAVRAIDGDKSNLWNDGSVSHTCWQRDPWWMVDFSDSPGPVDQVLIYNRMDWGQDKIKNVRVEVLDTDGSVKAWQIVTHVADQEAYTFDFGGVFGSAVRLSKPNTHDQIHFAEVEVYGARGYDSAAPTASPTVDFPHGAIMETWFNIGGKTIQDLKASEGYFGLPPDDTTFLETLNTPTNRADYFGARVCSYIVPPEDGYYHLYISSDDNGEVWFNPAGEDKDGVELVASVGWAPNNSFERYPSQKSMSYYLTAHTKYYLEAFYKEEGGHDYLQIAWAYGSMTGPQLIPASNTWLPESCSPRPADLITDDNRAFVDYYLGIGSSNINYLKNAAHFPNSPNSTQELVRLEIPINQMDNYGARLRALVVAPATGEYTFYISSDDQSELYLRTSNDTTSFDYVNDSPIASVPGWTNPRQWNRYTSQKSVAVTLTEEQNFYVEAIMKEGGGGDNLAVGWTYGAMESVEIIGGVDLSKP